MKRFTTKICIFSLLLALTLGAKLQEVIEISLEANDYLLFDTSEEFYPVYYIEELEPEPNIPHASFCSYEQPKFNIKLFEKQWDHTDPRSFAYEDELLMVDDKLHVLMEQGLFQVFNVTFSENGEKISLAHYNEIQFEDINLLKALAGPFYLKLFYNSEFKKILIVVTESIFIVNVDNENKEKWLKTVTVDLQSIDPVIKTHLVGNDLFLLRKSGELEKWHMPNESSLFKVQSTVLNDLSMIRIENSEISDFFIEEKFIAFVETSSRSVYLSVINCDLDKLGAQKFLVEKFNSKPLKVFIANSKLFVLAIAQPNREHFLHEYLILANNQIEYSDSYHVDDDFSELYITDNYLFYSYQKYTTIIPHAFAFPEDLNRRLKVAVNMANIREIQPFQITRYSKVTPKHNYFSAAVGDHIGIFMAKLQPGKITCKTADQALGLYSLKLRIYRVRCQAVEFHCNASDYFHRDHTFRLMVVGSEDAISKKSSMEGMIIGLGVGCVVAVIVLLLCYLHVKNIKKSYIRYSDQSKGSEDKNPMRIFSKEELDSIDLQKKSYQENKREN